MTTPIESVVASRRWDSRGRPTVEVEMRSGRHTARALAPAGASTGSGEAIDLRDGGEAFGGYDVRTAITNVNESLAAALVGVDAADQAAVDAVIESADGTPNFARLGGNAAIATSMAALRLRAEAAQQPLFRVLDPAARRMPLPEIQIFGGGAHAARQLDLQDLLIAPIGASSMAEAIDWAVEIYHAAGRRLAEQGRRHGVADEGGWWPTFKTNSEALDELTRAIEAAGFVAGKQVGIAVDVASTELLRDGEYHLGLEGRSLDRTAWIAQIDAWLDEFPIVSIEDPVAEDDTDGMRELTERHGSAVQIVGDDYLVTDAARVRSAAQHSDTNCVLIKPNQAGTITRTLEAFRAAHEGGLTAIVSARSGETEDTTIAHLAVGLGADGFKLGSVTRGERTAKWNELLRIEELIGETAEFVGRSGLHRSAG